MHGVSLNSAGVVVGVGGFLLLLFLITIIIIVVVVVLKRRKKENENKYNADISPENNQEKEMTDINADEDNKEDAG